MPRFRSDGVTLQKCTHGCPIVHYENCRTCFGFGLFVSAKTGDLVPVTAYEATVPERQPPELRPCPECHSTEKGIPREADNGVCGAD